MSDRKDGGPLDPAEFRDVGHSLVDRLAAYLEGIGERPLFPGADPDELERLFDEPVPRHGTPLAQVVEELERKLLPYCTHVGHPGYFGLITPSPAPAGILGDLMASALNQNVGAWTIGPSAVALERRTVSWLAGMIGWGGEAGGNLTSGGMVANLIGAKLARDAVSQDTAQRRGVEGRWAAYTSEERHVSVDKSFDMVGIGREGLRVLPTDASFRLDIEALERAVAGDRRAGVRPLCIVAMGGSTNTGAVDPLPALRRIADREGMWLHVDAAYGGGMLLSRRHPDRLQGLHLADSVTIDPHKWFYAPLDVGAILVRDGRRLTESFGLEPPYLKDPADPEGRRYNYYVHGLEQSRRFRALKVWMSFKRYGADQIGDWIDANVDQALRLHDLAAAHPRFEPAVRPAMSAVCIRYAREGLSAGASAALHVEVARRVQESGRFWISTTRLKERTWFRINPVNFRTRLQHMDELFHLLVSECDRLASREASPGLGPT
ncbi:MAG TPA: aminotransferase class I/II-fold pyridoxal phosphate-dependent enzyme [Candidatus Polarisedimenticolia bacterium]|nr:aminotransferase class I/II-fold pyridoxal phosphate-dependent enzyme [Candidatus Polarisedimenticolia bacterium]